MFLEWTRRSMFTSKPSKNYPLAWTTWLWMQQRMAVDAAKNDIPFLLLQHAFDFTWSDELQGQVRTWANLAVKMNLFTLKHRHARVVSAFKSFLTILDGTEINCFSEK